MQAVSIGKPLFIDAIRAGDDKDRALCAIGLRHPAEQCGHKAKGGCDLRGGVRRNLVERAKGQAALREMGIDLGKVEGKRRCFRRRAGRSRQHPAKIPDGLFAVLR